MKELLAALATWSWAEGIVFVILLPLLAVGLGALIADPGERAWIKRLRRIERGREAQRSEH